MTRTSLAISLRNEAQFLRNLARQYPDSAISITHVSAEGIISLLEAARDALEAPAPAPIIDWDDPADSEAQLAEADRLDRMDWEQRGGT